MSKRDSKKKQKIDVEERPVKTGHYNFHDGKCKFDSRPKRRRTRGAQKKDWENE
jgi:hypothetical protein